MYGHGLGTTLYYIDRSPRHAELLRRSEGRRLARLAARPSLAERSLQRLGRLLVQLGTRLAGLGALPEAPVSDPARHPASA